MIQKSKTPEQILRDKYKDTITQFLKDNTLYDCLSHNNLVVVLDQSFTCWEVFQIFIEGNLEEAIFWNSDISNYDGVFTHADLIKVILRLYNNANLLKHKLKMNVIEEECDVNDEIEQQSHMEYLKQKFYQDLKSVTIRQWFQLVNDELDFSGVIGLVKGRMDEKLSDACSRINHCGISRIIVVDPESQQIMGTLHQKDVLVFLIKAYTQYYAELKNHPQQENIASKLDQSMMKIKQFYEKRGEIQIENESQSSHHHQYSCDCTKTVYQVFHSMMYSYRAISMPIVNERNQYIGSVFRRDILLIIKFGIYDMLSQPITEFLEYLKSTKSQIPAYQYLQEHYFTMENTVSEVFLYYFQVVEKLVLSENNCLVCLNQDNVVQEIITVSDIFGFILNQ